MNLREALASLSNLCVGMLLGDPREPKSTYPREAEIEKRWLSERRELHKAISTKAQEVGDASKGKSALKSNFLFSFPPKSLAYF